MRMGLRLGVLLLFLVLLGVLAALNTDFLTYPHTLYLGFATYRNMPMGLLLLLLMLIPVLVFYFWAGLTRLRAEADSARLLRDMEQLRTSLDAQESSRFAQLQSHLDQRLSALEKIALEKSALETRALPPGNANSQAELTALRQRVEALQDDLGLQLAQMDDYLKRRLG